MRIKFTTTIEEKILEDMKITAIKEGIDVNDLIEKQHELYKIYQSINKNQKNPLGN